MKLRIKDTETTLKVIGVYQIVGGIIGYWMIARLLMGIENINGPLLVLILIPLFLFGFSIQSGNLLLQKEKRKKGLIFSSILQAMQMFAFGVGKYAFLFFSGIKLIVGFNITDSFNIKFSAWLSDYSAKYNSDNEVYYFYLNLVAVFLLYVLIDIYEEFTKENKRNRISVSEYGPELTDKGTDDSIVYETNENFH
ncbi:MAG: hypothetical protein JXR71_12360 [Bacteroidales bacterium]|nr:hypothetical protein [Bacteroidales bacterium]